MEYVRFGNTGLMVSKLCLGAMDFPLKCDRETTRSTFFTAFDNGINFIDTADAYGRGESESVMGEVIDPATRHDLVIATKCWVKMYDRPGGGGREGGGCSRRHILQACEDSLRRLRTEWIDLYQLHHPDPITPVEETLSALDLLVQQGKVRYVGVCNHYAWQIAHLLGVAALHQFEPLVSLQCHYNILNRAVEIETAPFTRRFNVAVMTYGPLAGGLLTGKYKRGQPPPEGSRFAAKWMRKALTDEVFDTVEALTAIAEKNDVSLNQLALKWVLSKDFVTTPILGGSRPEHFEPLYGIFELQVDPDALAKIDELSARNRYVPFQNQPLVAGPPLALNRW